MRKKRKQRKQKTLFFLGCFLFLLILSIAPLKSYACTDGPERTEVYKGYQYTLDEDEGTLTKSSAKSNKVKILATEINSFTVANNKIFYIKQGALYQTNLNGNGRKRLAARADYVVGYKSSYLYFQYKDYIRRINIKTKKSTTLGRSDYADWEIKGNYIYFRNASSKNRLYRMSVSGKSKKKITKVSVNTFVICKNNIFCYNLNWGYSESSKLTFYKVNLKNNRVYTLRSFKNVDSVTLYSNGSAEFMSADGNITYNYDIVRDTVDTEHWEYEDTYEW